MRHVTHLIIILYKRECARECVRVSVCDNNVWQNLWCSRSHTFCIAPWNGMQCAKEFQHSHYFYFILLFIKRSRCCLLSAWQTHSSHANTHALARIHPHPHTDKQIGKITKHKLIITILPYFTAGEIPIIMA